jgi:hypothetical protein
MEKVNQNTNKTHCIRGHEFTPENTYVNGKGRGCVACRTQWQQAWHKKHYVPRTTVRVYTKKAMCKRGHLRTPDNLYGSSMCKQCMKERVRVVEHEKSREHYRQNAEKLREDNHKRTDALKLEVLTHYGPKGSLGCCGEACTVVDVDMLSLDHINNDGAAHRRVVGKNKTGEKMYRLVKSEGFPSGFQTLCMNHQTKKKLENARDKRL